MTRVIHYRPTSSCPEHWLQIHVRRLFVHTFHHHTLSIGSDGRIAIATGPFLTVLHPPKRTPFRPFLNPPLRYIYSTDENSSAFRKDSLTTSSHLTTITWTAHAIAFLDGSASLIIVEPPRRPNTTNFSLDTSTHLWQPHPVNLPHPSKIPSPYNLRQTNVRCFAYTRLSCASSDIFDQRLTFYSYLACGTDEATELYPLKMETLTDLSNCVTSALRIHSICTTAIASIDGVQTSSGLTTAIALADALQNVMVYTVSMKLKANKRVLSSQRVWSASGAFPPGPVISLSWSLHSTRNSFLTLAVAMGNDVIVVDWASTECSSLDLHDWITPTVHCVRDAHRHIVTAVQVCHDGSVVSAGMDGRVICWRILSVQGDQSGSKITGEINASILQDHESNEPVMALERTSNAFALASLTSTSRQGQEVCDSEVMRKFASTSRRSTFRLLVLAPYGNVEDVETAIASCANRLIKHPSHLDKPLTSWDASHFLHTLVDCAAAVVPRLRARLIEMVESHEAGNEPSTQIFVQRCRVFLWLTRVVDHPDGADDETHKVVKEISRRVRNSLLFVQYVQSLQKFVAFQATLKPVTRLERLSLEHMCQFVSTWRVMGLCQAESGLQTVRDVRRWLEPFLVDGESLTSVCTICKCAEIETPLVSEGVDPGSVWCTAGHSFDRCVSTALPVTDAVALECAGCCARAAVIPYDSFWWLRRREQCTLCYGGLVGAHCEAD